MFSAKLDLIRGGSSGIMGESSWGLLCVYVVALAPPSLQGSETFSGVGVSSWLDAYGCRGWVGPGMEGERKSRHL